ncbi:hypothetical protein KAW65_03985 [candidate division WOR-3 bacterium]|nr:hypothetical protein [candidate division WOR-3 bacterium]
MEIVNCLILLILFAGNTIDTTKTDSTFKLTSTTLSIQEEELEWIPISEILAQQIGIVKSNRELHFRGGCAGEEVFLVDGIEITDPVYRFPYISFNKDAISKMWVALDGFSAEYGNAMSGVVNILTKEGSENYDGNIKYFTNTDIGEHQFNFNIGGPIPLLENMTFFASGGIDTTKNYLPSILPKSNNGFSQKNGMLKLTWRPRDFLKIGFKGELLNQRYKIYDHLRSRGAWVKDWPLYNSEYSGINLSLTHDINPNTSYTIKLGKMNSHFKASSQGGKSYNEWKAIGTRLSWVAVARDSGWYDPKLKQWKDGWSEDRAWMWFYENVRHLGYWNPYTGEWEWDSGAKLEDIVNALNYRCYQTGTYLLSKSGEPLQGDTVYARGDTVIYYHQFNLDKYIDDIQRYGAGEISEDEIEPSGGLYMIRYNHDEFGRFEYNFYPFWYDRKNIEHFIKASISSQICEYWQAKLGCHLNQYELHLTKAEFINKNPYLDNYNANTTTRALYIANEIDYRKLRLNLGIRYDYFNPKVSGVSSKYYISPRLGVSFAFIPQFVAYSNWGKFAQLSGVVEDSLPWQETTMYTFGTKCKMSRIFQINLSAYYRDVKNLIIADSATIYGIDLNASGELSQYLSWLFSYSYLHAKHTETLYGFLGPKKLWFPANWDITSSFIGDISVHLPADFGSKSLFRPFSGSDVTFRLTYSSGAIFDSTDAKGRFVGKERMPSTSRVDLRLEKNFKIAGLKCGLFADIWNVLNKDNVLNVYSRAGKPDDDGDPPKWIKENYESQYEDYNKRYGKDYKSGWDMYQDDLNNWKRYCNNPDNYDMPRIIQIGIVTYF